MTLEDELYEQLLAALKHKDRSGYNKVKEHVIKELKHIPMFQFSYDQFIPYPEYDDPDFNNKIFEKKEFNRNITKIESWDYDKLSRKQCSISTFSLTSNQKFIKAFLSPPTTTFPFFLSLC